MKVLLVNTQLSTGGIATSMVNLCENLKDYPGIEVDVLLLNEMDRDTRYRLPKNINMVKFDNEYYNLYVTPFKDILQYGKFTKIIKAFLIKTRCKIMGSGKVIKTIMKNSKVYRGYDVAISFRNDEYQYSPNTIFGCNDFVLECTDASIKIAWIHNDPDRHGFTYNISKEKFDKFNYVVNVSRGCKERFDEIIPEFKHKSKLVYNTFNYDEIIAKSTECNPYENTDKNLVKLVTVGRIDNQQKRIDRVVKVCKKLQEANIYNYVWYIVGDGPDVDKLKEEIIMLGLSERIVFVGKQQNPFTYMRHADCLVMTSEYEAYGMTLVEALIVNTPVITTNHIAAKEIIEDGINGFIVENDTSGLENKVKLILQEKGILENLKNNITKQRVDRDIAVNQFLQLINLN